MNRHLLVLLAAALLASCGRGTTPVQTSGSDEDHATPATMAGGPGVSVEEARASQAQQPLLVNGYLIAEGGVVRLCTGLAESLPPRCGEPALEVVGVALDDYPTRSASGVTWTDQQVQVLGNVEDDRLRVRPDARG